LIGRITPTVLVIESFDVTHPEVFPYRHLVTDVILKDHPGALVQGLFVPILQIAAV
jgi:hypothetical protein